MAPPWLVPRRGRPPEGAAPHATAALLLLVAAAVLLPLPFQPGPCWRAPLPPTAFTGGRCALSPKALPGSRSNSCVALRARRHTSWVKKAVNIVHLRKLGHRQFSNKRFEKEMERISALQNKDNYVDFFLSFFRSVPTPGEYVMPTRVARQALTEIYGEGDTLQTLDVGDEDEDDELEDAPPRTVTREEFNEMKAQQCEPLHKNDPRYRAPRGSRVNLGLTRGVGKLLSNMPQRVSDSLGARSRDVQEGAQASHSSDDVFEEIWMGGASAAYVVQN